MGWLKVIWDQRCRSDFKKSDGDFFGGFGLALGHQSTFFLEIMVVILAVELAFARGWCNLWLESDSLLVIHLLLKDSLCPPWKLLNHWRNCKLLISKMNFRCSHCFRETNRVANVLANLALSCNALHWWSNYPFSIGHLLSHDTNGFPCYRFS